MKSLQTLGQQLQPLGVPPPLPHPSYANIVLKVPSTGFTKEPGRLVIFGAL